MTQEPGYCSSCDVMWEEPHAEEEGREVCPRCGDFLIFAEDLGEDDGA